MSGRISETHGKSSQGKFRKRSVEQTSKKRLIISYKRKSCWTISQGSIVEQDIYEETDVSLKTDLSNTKAKLEVFPTAGG